MDRLIHVHLQQKSCFRSFDPIIADAWIFVRDRSGLDCAANKGHDCTLAEQWINLGMRDATAKTIGRRVNEMLDGNQEDRLSTSQGPAHRRSGGGNSNDARASPSRYAPSQ
jgi:hypothetical protein